VIYPIPQKTKNKITVPLNSSLSILQRPRFDYTGSFLTADKTQGSNSQDQKKSSPKEKQIIFLSLSNKL
jgi:hypothetical protein